MQERVSSFKSFFGTLKVGVGKSFNRLFSNKMNAFNFFVDCIFFFILFFNSGYAYVNKNSKLAIMLLSFGIIFAIFLQLFNYSKDDFLSLKQKKPKELAKATLKKFTKLNFTTYIFLGCSLFAVISFFANLDISSFGSYVWNIGTLVYAFCFTKKYSFERFVKTFEFIIALLSIFALGVWILQLLFNGDFAPLHFISSNGNLYNNYFFLSFNLANASTRLSSIFWEPGLYASFLIICLAIEIVYKKKVNWYYIFLFSVCLILTRSTFAYAVSILLILLALFRILTKNVYKITALVVFVGIVAVVFVFFNQIVSGLSNLMPSIFDKIDNADVSFLTRLYSPLYNLKIFAKYPIFGAGISKTSSIYASYIAANPSKLDSQTTTTFLMMAYYGVVGAVPTLILVGSFFFNKKIDKFSAIILALLSFIIFNKEPHGVISVSFVFLFYMSEKAFDRREYRSTANQNSILYLTINGSSNNSILSRNISASFLIKGGAMLISLFSLPAYIAYFNDDAVLGVWLAILSLLTWILTFDFGLGNGLKNHLIAAIAKKDKAEAKKLISSTYFSIGSICLGILVLGLTLIPTLSSIGVLDLGLLFGTKSTDVNNVTLLITVSVIFSAIVLELFLKIISSILHAFQKQALTSTFTLITNLCLLIFALAMRNSFAVSSKLVALAIVYFVAVNIPLLITTILMFSRNEFLKDCRFSFSSITKETVRKVIGLGGRFFIIQICLLVINSTNEIMISSLLQKPEYVVTFQEYYRPFGIIVTIASLVVAPLWGTIAKAKEEKNVSWIKKNLKTMGLVMGLFCCLSLILVGILQPFFNLWLGDASIPVNYIFGLIFALFSCVQIIILFETAYANGLGTLKVQLIFGIVGAGLKFPLFLLLSKLDVFAGQEWVCAIIANVLALLPIIVVQPIECLVAIKKLERRNNESI